MITKTRVLQVISAVWVVFALSAIETAAIAKSQQAIHSFDTGFTITKLILAKDNNSSFIVASSYEGTLFGFDFSGKQRWQRPLSGAMNHAIYSADINHDGIDEILAANADGSIYALTSTGQILWQFKENDAPMNAVTVITHQGESYVVCGGYDTQMYYLDSLGKKVKQLDSVVFGQAKVFSNGKDMPEPNRLSINFLKTLKQGEHHDIIALHGTNNSLQSRGAVYFFKPLADKPFKTIQGKNRKSIGEIRIADIDDDGNDDLLLGSSTTVDRSELILLNSQSYQQTPFPLAPFRKKLGNGYRVAQTEQVIQQGKHVFLTLFGNHLLLSNASSQQPTQVLTSPYAYYDLAVDKTNNQLFLASSQSGGSAIHVINLNHSQWQQAFETLTPPGKIATILQNTQALVKQVATFKAPEHERSPLPVYFLTENMKGFNAFDFQAFQTQYPQSPIFYASAHMPKVEQWDRSNMTNNVYRTKRDRRKQYVLTQSQALAQILPLYQGTEKGAAFWGGHGNDPYMFSLETKSQVLNYAHKKGKETALIYPELESSTTDFAWVMDDLFYPLAQQMHDKSGKIYVRTKHTFWQSMVYMPLWERLISGEFADVFVPSMEETTDKSMELSLAARMGVWLSGSVNQWGSRSVRDNPSFDRMRQYSHQMLPNHFLRQMVYHISNGASYLNNFRVDQNYMSVLWQMVAKGLIYVPKREELLHISPVHLGMLPPDKDAIEEGNNVKWTSFFNPIEGEGTPLVFDRLNGTWPGAKNTPWDFSRYAAGVHHRRQNFLPNYPYGIVLLTPPQHKSETMPRGKLVDKLHPSYQKVLTEFLTDGKYYFSADLKQRYSADEYASVIENKIKTQAQHLPLTVSGNVAWTLAQSGENHLRLTLIDGGYLNPNEQQADIQINTIAVKHIKDLVTGEHFKIDDDKHLSITVPTGLFRFIDIELQVQPVQSN